MREETASSPIFQDFTGRNILKFLKMTFCFYYIKKEKKKKIQPLKCHMKSWCCYLGNIHWNSAQGSQRLPIERSSKRALKMVIDQLNNDRVTEKHIKGVLKIKSMKSICFKKILFLLPRMKIHKNKKSSYPKFPKTATEKILMKNSHSVLQTFRLISTCTGKE